MNLHGYRTLDGQQAADIVFEEVVLPTEACLIQGQAAKDLLSNALDSQLIGLSAEALGCMEAALDMTVAYCKDRQQFGQAIGKFQAIQHKLADMFILCQGVRSLLYAAAIMHSTGATGCPCDRGCAQVPSGGIRPATGRTSCATPRRYRFHRRTAPRSVLQAVSVHRRTLRRR